MATVTTCLALLASSAAAFAPAGAAQAEPKAAPPLAASPSAPDARVVPASASGDFSNPPGSPAELTDGSAPQPKPVAFDPARSTVIEAETTETIKVFRNPSDGSKTAQVSAVPVRFKDAGGKWVENDLTLTPGADGSLKATAAKNGATIGASASKAAATVVTEAGPITARHPDASAATPATDKAAATYAGALAGRDLQVALTHDGFEAVGRAP